MSELNLAGFEKQDIKTNPLTEQQLEELYKMAGSYESLFSKRARKYKALGLKDKKLSEDDFKHYLLSDYTFLKRPVIIVDDKIFIGNSPKVVEGAKKLINER
jgi:arsenate reductase